MGAMLLSLGSTGAPGQDATQATEDSANSGCMLSRMRAVHTPAHLWGHENCLLGTPYQTHLR